MIEGLHQRHYKNAIINVLEAWGGEAYGRDVIAALMNDPRHKLDLTAEEKVQIDLSGGNTFKHACRAAAEQLRKDGYIKKSNLIKEEFGQGRRSFIYLQIIN